jgi:hypothetical protein
MRAWLDVPPSVPEHRVSALRLELEREHRVSALRLELELARREWASHPA